jgi:alginate O-acetyltransferase complex protein AlgI
MIFSSPIFLYLFLPLTLLLTYISPGNIRNYILLLASLLFYAWGGIGFVALLIFSFTVTFFFGLAVNAAKLQTHKKLALAMGIAGNLGVLVYFKYMNFFVFNLNTVLSAAGFPALEFSKIILPIGISFFTFQAMSYLVDVYRNNAPVQKNFLKLALYISLFPQLLAGPIVRYKNVADQIESRTTTIDSFASGIRRFAVGLARKTLIADPLALAANQAFSTAPDQLTTPMAWLGIIAYTLQIYFDFAGYSDMAIGLARMLGFEFQENFNSPYVARSIKEFWQRWHISLSTWFRDYLYIPLGGNRHSPVRTYVNLLIVFVVCGFWHGAAWNFFIWGMIHGFFIIIERLGFEHVLKKLPRPLSHAYALAVVMIAWVFFRADDWQHALAYIKAMSGINAYGFQLFQVLEFAHAEFIIIAAAALLGSTPVFIKALSLWQIQIQSPSRFVRTCAGHAYYISAIVSIVFCLFFSTMYLIANSYNPFIYFRF